MLVGKREQQRAAEAAYGTPYSSTTTTGPLQNPSPPFQQTAAPTPASYVPGTDPSQKFNDLAVQQGGALYNNGYSVDNLNIMSLDAIDEFILSTRTSGMPPEPFSDKSHYGQDLALTSPSAAHTSSTGFSLNNFYNRDRESPASNSNSTPIKLPPSDPGPNARPGTVSPSDHDGLDSSAHDASSCSSPAAPEDKGWFGGLHIAARRGHDRIVRTLLQHNVNCNERDSDGSTPLIHAVIEDHEAVVACLLAHGARIGEGDNVGRSALHWAVLHRRESLLRLLLGHFSERERELEINTYDDFGWTPLHMAIERGFEEGVQLLLQYGANLHSRARKCPTTGNIILDRNP